MALDKQFLKYKLEKIKNDRIWKEQDSETKKRIRKDNSELAAAEADAIHSYLTGEDNIDSLDNKSFLENRMPGNLFLTPKKGTQGKKEYWQGELNIRQVQTDPKTKKTRLSRLLKKFRTIAKSNIDSSKQMVIFKKIFDKLNITFGSDEIKIDGDLNLKGDLNITNDAVIRGDLRTNNIWAGEKRGITVDYNVADVVENTDGTVTYISRKRIIVKNGLIVDVRRI
jgi:hypothetical protein